MTETSGDWKKTGDDVSPLADLRLLAAGGVERGPAHQVMGPLLGSIRRAPGCWLCTHLLLFIWFPK